MPPIDQSGASAGGDVVAGNKTVNQFAAPTPTLSIIEQLLHKLQAEIEKNEEVRHRVESLQYFYEHKSTDGVDGLEAKLTAGGRDNE